MQIQTGMDAVARLHAVDPGVPPAVPAGSWSRLRKLVITALVLIPVLALVVLFARVHAFVTSSNVPAPVRPPTPLEALSDVRPVAVTLTTPAWTKERVVVSVDRLRTDRTLWREMHFDDWDQVPVDLREQALQAMVRAYAPIFLGSPVWRAMGPEDWDAVPQPIRAMAYLRMIWFWTLAEDVGSEFGLEPRALAHTVAAIVMAESWFEHRAVNENEWGNRDLGLAQCSDHCRAGIVEMALHGEITFMPHEAEYFDPWTAARVATIWFERELLRAGGDVDLAIRAYHRGMDAAMDEKGTAYHARVVRLRERYIRAQTASASWRFLTRAIAPL